VSTVSVAASYRGLLAEPVLRGLAVADVCTLALAAAAWARARPVRH